MRVLWLSHLIPYPPTAGVMMRSYYLLKSLAERCDVHFLSLVQPSLLTGGGRDLRATIEEAEADISSFCRTVTIVRDSGFEGGFLQYKALARSLLSGHSFTAEWARSKSYERAVKALVRKVGPDIVHVDTMSLMIYERCVEGTSIVLNHHNIESHLMVRRARDSIGWLQRVICNREARLLREWERNVCGRVESNLVCSDLDGKRLREHVPAAVISVVPNCLPVPPDPRAGISRDSYALCFIGTMNWRPNAEAARFLVQEIWPLLRGRDGRYRLNIVGRHPEKRLLDAAKIDDRLIVHGFVDSTEEMFRTSGIFVCPITDGGGTKLKLIEAMAFELPIVAHPISCEGLGLVNGETVLLAQTPQEFADAVHRLTMDTHLAESLGARAKRHFLSELSVDAVSDEMFSEYLRVVGASAR